MEKVGEANRKHRKSISESVQGWTSKALQDQLKTLQDGKVRCKDQGLARI